MVCWSGGSTGSRGSIKHKGLWSHPSSYTRACGYTIGCVVYKMAIPPVPLRNVIKKCILYHRSVHFIFSKRGKKCKINLFHAKPFFNPRLFLFCRCRYHNSRRFTSAALATQAQAYFPMLFHPLGQSRSKSIAAVAAASRRRCVGLRALSRQWCAHHQCKSLIPGACASGWRRRRANRRLFIGLRQWFFQRCRRARSGCRSRLQSNRRRRARRRNGPNSIRCPGPGRLSLSRRASACRVWFLPVRTGRRGATFSPSAVAGGSIFRAYYGLWFSHLSTTIYCVSYLSSKG